MPKLNRRRFLQVATAAGLSPALPAFSGGAAAGTGTASHSQMLWASLHARAGSPQAFARVTSSMGLTPRAATGVSAKIIQGRVLTAHSAARVNRLANPARPRSVGSAPQPDQSALRRRLDRFLKDPFDGSPQLDEAEQEEPNSTTLAASQSDGKDG